VAIKYNEEQKTFSLHTEHAAYQMQIGKYGHLLHLYYGNKVDGNMDYLLTYADRGFSGNPYAAGSDRTYSLDSLPQEFPTQGTGDYRITCLTIKNADGSFSCDLRYKDYKIVAGKYTIPGLPAVYADPAEAETLEIYLADPVSKVQVTLKYGILEKNDIITRTAVITNAGDTACTIESASSACLDFLYGDYELYTFYGRHAMERNLQRAKLMHGVQSIGSKRGTSSHQYNPFMILAGAKTTEDYGECYGMCYVYSGNFKAKVELDQYDQTRIIMGLQDELFSYELEPHDVFNMPEVVMSFSNDGLSRLSQNYHDTFRNNLCRGKYKTIPRPVLLNNWEATYFDFDGDAIFQIARQAAELGVEMLVLDDGWFGNRNDDNHGLGDWYANEQKLGGSLSHLADRINGIGMKFGIWMEPEMVNEESVLFREHPDWAFSIPGREPIRARNQLVLDFSRNEVVEYIFTHVCAVLDSANIEYLKWDMNRSISDVYSTVNHGAAEGAVLYKYTLGLYDFLERLIRRYPDLLIEGCSGGGGRFDAGMLYYTPQIWCSDNSDAIDRIRIQEGTSFAYPISSVGSHVSASPNHQTGRIAQIQTRGVVAMAGSYGFELDLGKSTDEEKEYIKKQIAAFHKYSQLIHNGDYYRLTCSLEDTELAAWEFAAKDKSEALLNVVTLSTHGNPLTQYIRCKGLNPDAGYEVEGTELICSGKTLMNAGIPVPYMTDEYQSWQVHLKQI